MSCPATGIRDFPIQNTVIVTQTLNDSIYQATTTQVQWARRGTVPTFDSNFFTEGIYSSDPQTTTLRFEGNQYTLKTVQLVEPQHKGLLKVKDKELAIAEIVMVFESSTALTQKFVILCSPLLDRSDTSYSPYLEGVRLDRLSGRPVSLNDLLPKSKLYTSYSTCLQQVQSGSTTAVNATVLVFTEGLSYPKAQLQEVLKKIKGLVPPPAPVTPPRAGTVAPPPVVLLQPPSLTKLMDGLLPKVNTNLFLISTEADYKNFLRTSELTFQPVEETGRRVDSTDSYKCVPLKPDETVKNKQIIIDTDKGVPLSQVLKEKADEQGEGKITPGMVERMIAIVLGTAAGLFVLSILAYVFSRVTTDSPDASFPWFMGKIKDLVPMVFMSMVVGVIGFLIGFFTSTT